MYVQYTISNSVFGYPSRGCNRGTFIEAQNMATYNQGLPPPPIQCQIYPALESLRPETCRHCGLPTGGEHTAYCCSSWFPDPGKIPGQYIQKVASIPRKIRKKLSWFSISCHLFSAQGMYNGSATAQGMSYGSANSAQGMRNESANSAQGMRHGSANSSQGMRKRSANSAQGMRDGSENSAQGMRNGSANSVLGARLSTGSATRHCASGT
jgi:hypothetical protein